MTKQVNQPNLPNGYQASGAALSGGHGSVFQATQVSTGRVVAIKQLHAGTNPDRIRREAKVLQAVKHDNIAQLYEFVENDDGPFLIMEWVEHKQLRELILSASEDRAVSSPLHDVVFDHWKQVFAQLADALQFAHGKQVVHGDVNAGNVLITDSGHVKLVDFGLGRIDQDMTVTASAELAGTAKYLSPEVIKGESPTARSDQYALAVLLFEMLCGRWVYGESGANFATALHHHLYTRPDRLSEISPGFTPAIDNVLLKALAKDPAKRFESVDAFKQAVLSLQLMRDEPVSASTLFMSTKASSLQGRTLAVPLIVCALVFVIVFWQPQTQTLAMQRAVTPKSVGEAVDSESLKLIDSECNLFKNARFNDELDENFYQDKDNPDLIERVQRDGTHVSGHALRVGKEKIYGLYGVKIPVKQNTEYAFSADVEFVGLVEQASLTVDWMDANWNLLEGKQEELFLPTTQNGRYSLKNIRVPENAMVAVPTFFKNGSDGIVYFDNVVFHPVSDECAN